MKQWHVEHMEKTIIGYVKGLPHDASAWEKRNHRKYGNLTHICRQIEYDIKHGVTDEEVKSMFNRVRNDSSFSSLRKNAGSMERLVQVEAHFARPKIKVQWY
jgi:hypothetical protein